MSCKAIEESHQVISVARIILRFRHFEFHAIADACFRCRLPGHLDRAIVIIKARERRFRIRLRHENRGCSKSAANVRHFRSGLQLRFDVAERRNPFTDQVRAIVGTKETFGAREQPVIVFVPTDSVAGAEGFRDFWLVFHARRNDFEKSREKNGARLVRQSERLFRRQCVASGGGVVGDESSGGLRCEPFANVPLGCSSFLREFGRSHRSGAGHCFV